MELARRGVAVVLVGTDRFEPLAQQVASSLGASWLPEVVVHHPIGGRTEKDLQLIFEAAWSSLQAELGGFAGGPESSGAAGPSAAASEEAPSTNDVASDSADGMASTPAGDRDTHPPAVQAALDRLQEMIDEGYRLELEKEEDGVHVLYVIAEDEACADCLVPDEVLASILTAEVASNGLDLGKVRVEHGPRT